tara:strand:+ start:946 stop:1566 length:621 start_codon:yes stop_codon:yes gene_type:complete
MSIEIKKSIKPVLYKKALKILERKVENLHNGIGKELIWFLEHESIFTSGINFNEKDIIDNKIKIIKTNRGGKITWHGPGQLICYFVIDLNKRNKDIRNFVIKIENSIIESLKELKISSFSDRKNIGIWIENKNKIEKIAAIGIKVKKWIAFHGFSLNISNEMHEYEKIIPCGIKDRGVTSLNKIGQFKKEKIIQILKKNLIRNLNY